ncbi:MAG: hypothetical protein HC800_08765 [Phormidesmis sp. RL_2_1]|nr:hypothetical protein [Phormidesmis sp. RL_2_1]
MDKSVCFSVLAFNPKYQQLAKNLAADIAQHSPETTLVIGTDHPDTFRDCSNVFAFKLQKKGVLHCYNDKRFVIEKALQQFKTVIQIDADTKITAPFPESIDQSVGIAGSYLANMVEHSQKYNPGRLTHLKKLAHKLELDPNSITFVGEALFAITAEGKQAADFIQQWDRLARYLELNGLHSGEGNAIGLAAAKAGLAITAPDWLASIQQGSEHLDVSRVCQPSAVAKPKNPALDKLMRSVSYHYRLNKSRLIALKNFNFYYR